jgi:hypothetical protein
MTPQLHVRLTYRPHSDPQLYNLPTGNEIAVILPGVDEAVRVVELLSSYKVVSISTLMECSPMYAPLHYVILFPKGDLGWTWDIPYRDAEWVNNNNAEDANDNAEDANDDAEDANNNAQNGRCKRKKKCQYMTQIEYYAYTVGCTQGWMKLQLI